MIEDIKKKNANHTHTYLRKHRYPFITKEIHADDMLDYMDFYHTYHEQMPTIYDVVLNSKTGKYKMHTMYMEKYSFNLSEFFYEENEQIYHALRSSTEKDRKDAVFLNTAKGLLRKLPKNSSQYVILEKVVDIVEDIVSKSKKNTYEGHNDLTLDNFVYDDETLKVKIIDPLLPSNRSGM